MIPCYVLDTRGAHPRRPGAASRWWLHHSLAELDQRIRQCNGRLLLKRGDPVRVLTELALEAQAGAVFFSHAVEPQCRRDEAALTSSLEAHGIGAQGFEGNLLFPPEEIQNRSGAPFRVFTPFWKHCLANCAGMRAPTGPVSPEFSTDLPDGDVLDDWGLLPTHPDWAAGLKQTWQPGETAGQAMLARYRAQLAEPPSAAKAERYSKSCGQAGGCSEDVLRDDGVGYHAALRDAGVDVRHVQVPGDHGCTHRPSHADLAPLFEGLRRNLLSA